MPIIPRLGRGDTGGALGLGLLHPRHPAGLRLLLGGVPLRVGGLAHLGVQLAVLQRGLPLGDLLLLGEDVLLPGRLREGTRGVGAGLGLIGLGLDLGLLQVEGPLCDRDLLFRLQPRLLGRPPGDRLRDVGLLLRACRFGAAEVLQVGTLGGDVLDLEGVEHQALPGQARLRLLGDLAGEGGPVPDDVLHGHPADDRAQRAGQHLLGEADDAVLLHQEPLRRGPDRVLRAADLDDRDAFEVGLHPAQRHRAAHGDRDVPGGEVEREPLLHERHDEHAAAHHDLLAAVVGEHTARLRIGGPLAAPPGDDERLARAGHLVAADHHQGEQHQEYDDSHHRDDDRTHDNAPESHREKRTERTERTENE